jgi:hypothetical protein
MSTSATIASLSMAVLGTLPYHVFQKEIPANANPALALIVMYATGLVLSFGLLLWFRPTTGLATGVYLVYGERLSVINAAAVVASLVGLALINWKSA